MGLWFSLDLQANRKNGGTKVKKKMQSGHAATLLPANEESGGKNYLQKDDQQCDVKLDRGIYGPGSMN